MIDLASLEAWLITGSQHLYGPETLKRVEKHAAIIAEELARSSQIPVKIVSKPVMTGSESIHQLCMDANHTKNCVGLITWMHTFSPARMWIAGLRSLNKPSLHFHTQFNEQLPWSSIDMDFMNLNQSAHGDREFGFLGAKMRLQRKVVVGFWKDEAALAGQLRIEQRFEPAMSADRRDELQRGWQRAVERSRGWAAADSENRQ